MSAPTATAAPPGQPYTLPLALAALVATHERLKPTPEADAELLASIVAGGLLSPLEVAADEKTVLNGTRRRRVMMAAGIETASCRVNPAVVNAQQIARAQVAMDIQERRPLIDLATRFSAHLAAAACTQSECAKYFGVSEATVTRGLRMTSCSPAVAEALASKAITPAHLSAVAKVKDGEKREAMLLHAAAESLTAAALAKLVKTRPAKGKASEVVTFAFAGLTIIWPKSWVTAEVLKAMSEYSEYLKASTKAFSVASIPVGALIPKTTAGAQ